ncbi:MAG: hypothetical protein SNJ74_10715 [Fimbriimonadaceae bacterium]
MPTAIQLGRGPPGLGTVKDARGSSGTPANSVICRFLRYGSVEFAQWKKSSSARY